ncbi:MAG: hypothetical protein KH443_00835 [Oscillospiraceae bacterium]|nr:hypothetical protein [Oscillospiraceae bacterium]
MKLIVPWPERECHPAEAGFWKSTHGSDGAAKGSTFRSDSRACQLIAGVCSILTMKTKGRRPIFHKFFKKY